MPESSPPENRRGGTNKPVTKRELYDRFDPNREPLQQARALFLDAYASENRRVLIELESFTAEATSLQRDPNLSQYLIPPDCWLLSAQIAEFERLRQDLFDWASRFNLTVKSSGHLVPAPWVMDITLSTLSEWARSPNRRPLTIAHNPDRLSPWVNSVGSFQREYLEDSRIYEFQVEGRRLNETRQQFKKRVYRECSQIVEKRLLEDDQEQQRDEDRRACWANKTEITPAAIERLAQWQANPNSMLKEIDPRALTVKGMGNASRDLTEAAEYIQITRRAALTAARKDRTPRTGGK